MVHIYGKYTQIINEVIVILSLTFRSMLFDLITFVEELKEQEGKKELATKYVEYFGEIHGTIVDQFRYQEYVGKFVCPEYHVPEYIKDKFDRVLLAQLSIASFSAEVIFEVGPHSPLPECVISVESDGTTITKMVSELRGFQVLRLFEIYCEEQMQLAVHMHDDTKEKEEIEQQRSYKIKKWTMSREHVHMKEQKVLHEIQKKEELQNLYDQL